MRPAAEQQALVHTVHEAYMEVFPTSTIESKLDVLQPGSYVAVTCSPTKGVDVTLDLSARLAHRGFKVVPHIAAKMIRDKSHLRDVLGRLNDLPIVSIFVPGGDADAAIGNYGCALDLLRAIAEFDHKFTEIGVAAHPEGHPAVSDDVLMEHLFQKQEVANYLVTQMCFDATLIGDWLARIRAADIKLPAWIGLPGVMDRATLFKTSLRIGVGDSARFLKRHGKTAARLFSKGSYKPDDLLYGLAPYLADPAYGIAGHHLYCFNQVARAERWRHEFLERLNGAS
jgi:methylenetetrahydrofolate reductase (NADPH)